jgi:streptogramin lyase
MQDRYRRLLLVVSVSLWVVVSLAEHALALAPTCIEFNTPTTDSVPAGITAGPDGALWFTEQFKNKIGAHHDRRCDYRVPDPYARQQPR